MSMPPHMPIIVSDKTELRRCVMHLWRSYNGLGLILKYLKTPPAPNYPKNLIKEVEIGSPAHYAGVLNNDLIIKVGQRLVEQEKFDTVLKLIRDQLKKEKRVELLLINLDYFDQFRQKYENSSTRKIDYNNTLVLAQIKHYQSPLYDPNTSTSKQGSVQGGSSVNLNQQDSAPEPRLCHLLTWSNYDGYGFYVAYNSDGCFVKNVEPNSPAQYGGLRDYDRIIEINGKQIKDAKDSETIQKIITKHKSKNGMTVKTKSASSSSSYNGGGGGGATGTTKSSKSTTSLSSSSAISYLDVFVADPNTYKWLNDRGIPISVKNKGLKIQEVFTPAENTILNLINQNNHHEESSSSPQPPGSQIQQQQQQQSNLASRQASKTNSSESASNKMFLIKCCTIRRLKGKENQPLGFEMTKRGNNPNFISRVEPNSSAALSGLCFEDYIIELNEKNVEQEENSLLKEKIFKNLEPENGGEFRFTTINKNAYDYCIENQIRPSDLIRNNRQSIKYFETPLEMSSIDANRRPSLPPPPPPPPIQQITSPSSVIINSVNLNNNSKYMPRLCVIDKKSDDQELGISIARIKNFNEHIISEVAQGSLADLAGIKPNDCLLEVNGENVEAKSHSDTIKMIADLKRIPQTKINLLVAEKPHINSINTNNINIKQNSLSTPDLTTDRIKTNIISPSPNMNHHINHQHNPSTGSSSKNVVTIVNKPIVERTITPLQIEPNKLLPPAQTPSINVYPEIKVCEFLGYARGTQLGLVITSDDYSHDVVKVADNSPAQKAGLAKGDVIIAVNDQNVEGNPSSIELLNDFSETKALKVLAASRYAYEWSKLLRIKITEKDWPNIKKFSTKHIPIAAPTAVAPVAVTQQQTNNVQMQSSETLYRQTQTHTSNSIYSQSNYYDPTNRNILMRNEVTTTSNLNPDDNTRNIYYHQRQLPASSEIVSSTMKLVPGQMNQYNNNSGNKRVVSSASTIRSDHFSLMSNLSRSAVDITTDGKVLRLCTLILDPTSPIPTDSEFGFDLVTKIGNNQRIGDYYIDTVDMFSPACCSGLKPGDRLIEVDGIDVSNKTFEQVVQLINEAKLRSKLKLLVYPSIVINYGNPNVSDHQDHMGKLNQNLTNIDSRSMPDLSTPIQNDFVLNRNLQEYSKSAYKNNNSKKYNSKQMNNNSNYNNNNEYDSIYFKKGSNLINGTNNLSKSNSNIFNGTINSNSNNHIATTTYPIENMTMTNMLRPLPRLCTIYKNEVMIPTQTNSNIGFGVQARSSSSIIPNYMRVSIVNYKSPAYVSGLEAGDYIIEINGRNTLSMTHEEALHFIKSSYELNNYVKLLVVSEFCYNWLKENDLLSTLNSDDRSMFSYADYLKYNHRYVPRLCRVRLFPFSKSFGFTVESLVIRPLAHASSASSTNKLNYPTYAHIISRVDKDSPAYSSSLQKGDRIIECDGINIENETEQQVNERIYQAFLSTKQINLYVVDPDTDNYFKSKCIKLHSMLPINQHITNSTDI